MSLHTEARSVWSHTNPRRNHQWQDAFVQWSQQSDEVRAEQKFRREEKKESPEMMVD